MLFALLVLAAAFLIEGIGTYVSVVGLSSLFAANPVIILLAVSLDIGKVVAVSFLYKYWSKIGWLMKSYMSVAALVLMLITSSGAFGYLSGEFQKAIADTSTGAVITASLTEEQGRLQKRKEDIDKQISQLKDDNVGGRTRLMRSFGPEIKRINDRLADIDKELPKLKVEAIKKNVEVGPIIYIADAFNTTPEKAVKWVILLIIFVFDPLAISLLLAGNYLIELRKQEKKEQLLLDKVAIIPVNVEEKVEQAPLEKSPDEIKKTEEHISSNDLRNDLNNNSLNAAMIKKTEEHISSNDLRNDLQDEAVKVEKIINEDDIPEVVQEDYAPVYEQNISQQIEKTNTEPVIIFTPEAITPLDKPVEKFVLHQEIPILDPVEEIQSVEDREVITLEQITKPKAPLYRSLLEDVNAKHGDIQTDEDDRSRSMRTILDTYRGDLIPEPEKSNAVFVGGPSDKIR